MNFLMTGMIPIAALGRKLIGAPLSPLAPDFWFVMSMALLTGFVVAYPINWWLVAKGLKHGMMTVRLSAPAATHDMTAAMPMAGAASASHMDMGSPGGNALKHPPPPSVAQIGVVAAFSVVAFGLAIWLALALGGA